ncbi:MAG: polyprenyl synthetase family protein, partial [Bacteroidales bacterium]|nr:polyprenyl synthetase family protein [Bacteroidales bacterium]
ILSGDVMSIMAYQMMGAYKGANHASVLELFSKTAAEVCEGQQYDMDFEDLPLITMDEYLKMIGLKTAVLIACSAKMGALIAGSTSAQADALYNFGYQLGMAFQITDDYLDTFGDASVFGKKIGGDIENNKKTWLLVECLRLAAGNDKAELDSLIKMNDNLQKKVEDVRNLYLRLGIDKAALKAIEVYHDKAMQTLKEAGFNAEQIAYLADMAKEMVYREY